MPTISSIFLVLALALAVVIGPQTRAWTWGPALLALGLAVTAALPEIWRHRARIGDWKIILFGTVVASWFAWRAWLSPVAEFRDADLLLLAGVVGTFLSVRSIQGNPVAERILIWGIALLLLANVIVIGRQISDPSFIPVFSSRGSDDFPSGFYAHYNEAANYLIASSFLLGGVALVGKHRLSSRLIWGAIGIAGLTAVYFTRSRGGILGAAIGAGAFACFSLTVAHRSRAKWFGPAFISIPVLGLMIVLFLTNGWRGSQQLRNAGVRFEEVFDNSYRLYLLGIAQSCISLHPLLGGGSGSFSWECFRFFDPSALGGAVYLRPEYIHNELLQAATDYGLLGFGLLTGLIVSLFIACSVSILLAKGGDSIKTNGWKIGSIAALIGMLIQSCFSFVFHLFPGCLLLGLCLGQLSPTTFEGEKSLLQRRLSPVLLMPVAITCVALLFLFGWKGSRVTHTLWPVYFGVPGISAEQKIERLSDAIDIWPKSEFYQKRAMIYQEAATNDPGLFSQDGIKLAIQDYAKATELHPFDPGPPINRAKLLSQLQMDSEAEDAYNLAIKLQGGAEPAYQARYSFACHLLDKGLRQLDLGNHGAALATLEKASQQIELALKEDQRRSTNNEKVRAAIYENLGIAREAHGDFHGAVAAYDFVSKLNYGSRAYYRAGVLYGKMASSAWASRKPSEALALFMEGQKMLNQSTELPDGVKPEKRTEYLVFYARTIEFLKGAKIEPSPSPAR